jgi:hypothetical protein
MGKVLPVWWWTAGGIVLLALVVLVAVCLRVLGRLEPLTRAQRRLQERMVEAQALTAAADSLATRAAEVQKAAEQAQATMAELKAARQARGAHAADE